MRYRNRYTRRTSTRQKYSVENVILSLGIDTDTSATTHFSYQGIQDVVPALFSNFPRKVSHIHLHFDQSPLADFIWALVYVPAGYTPNSLGLTSDAPNLYNPNQFLMASGYVSSNGGRCNFTVPLKRILHSGDNIRLICAHNEANAGVVVNFAARYAICAL